MNIQAFTAKWFIFYYPVLGILFLGFGIWLIIKSQTVSHYLLVQSKNENPPVLIRTILKYFFLFTIPGLIFSFLPFSWTELLFALWSLLIVYIIGIQLVRWPQTRQSIQHHPKKLPRTVKFLGVIMLSVSPVMFLLSYLVIKRLAAS